MSDEDDIIDNDHDFRPNHIGYDDDDDDSDEDNRPLVPMTNGQNGNVNNHHYEDDSDDDSEDNVPLVNHVRRQAVQAVATRPAPTTSSDGGDEDDSDDDIPLAQTLRPPPVAAVTGLKRTTKSTLPKKPPAKRRKEAVKQEPRTTGRKQTHTQQVKKEAVKREAVKREATTRKPRVKKEDETKKYDMPGQRRDTPPENDPARLFYQSMYNEKRKLGKKSDVATTWMLRHGLLEKAVAMKLA